MEAAVIASIRAGNPDAFEEVINRYQVPISRYLYRLTGDYETARDLTQDTFIKAYRSILKTDSELKLNACFTASLPMPLYSTFEGKNWLPSYRLKIY